MEINVPWVGFWHPKCEIPMAHQTTMTNHRMLSFGLRVVDPRSQSGSHENFEVKQQPKAKTILNWVILELEYGAPYHL